VIPHRVIRAPRQLHPGAWWLWALGLLTAATRTTNPVLLALIVAVAGYVVTARRTDAPWARAYAVFLKIGLVVLAIRLVAQVVLGVPVGQTVLFTLPSADLPEWAAGISLGGSVTAESVLAAGMDGLRLATILVCIGAANALANPKRLLASMPAALYEVGVAVVVALAFAPSLVTSVRRVRDARRLRGRPDRGLRSVISVALPVLEDALDRSLSLAAAMDSRGYGRQASVSRHERRVTAVLTLGGLVGICIGLYGMLDGGGPAALSLPLLVGGAVAAAAGVRLAGRRAVRTRYRPDPWAAPESLTAGAGTAAAAAAFIAAAMDPASMEPSVVPLTAPQLPAVAVAGALIALLPAWLTPPTVIGHPRATPPAPGRPAAVEVEA
jgi:energy-coupling factor transport system permease protein